MKTVKQIYDKLPEQGRRQLLHAFERGFQQYIELPDNQFIGVNVKGVPHLSVEQEAGLWAIGTVRKPQ